MKHAFVEERLLRIFVEVFDASSAQVGEMRFRETPAWDSVHHLLLITRIEDELEVELATSDVLEMVSFDACVAAVVACLDSSKVAVEGD